MSDSFRRDISGTSLRADVPGRRIYGVCVPYSQPTRITEYDGSTFDEMFVKGSFARSIAQRQHKIKLLAGHDQRRFPIGRATSLVERDDGLHGEFAVPQTAEGDDVLELVRSGTLDAFSVCFEPVRDRRERGVLVRAEAKLLEVSLVPMPAYENALVAGVRAASPGLVISRSLAQARIDLMKW
ncbi:HK97 family phage prohead protease [Mycobacterium marinum]|uniref:HK97 family phage prohead protease n=1 Tax=Mycobacterium marinum TaxID=1781 RepID=UPI0023594E81|nr:HK97 family phage prohead protease [Mycobacterium marinum]MDC8981249.1 HK97 family phage prohead protease [Mycobacterium marinum]